MLVGKTTEQIGRDMYYGVVRAGIFERAIINKTGAPNRNEAISVLKVGDLVLEHLEHQLAEKRALVVSKFTK